MPLPRMRHLPFREGHCPSPTTLRGMGRKRLSLTGMIKNKRTVSHRPLSVYFRLVCPVKDIIDAYIIKCSQTQKGLGRGDSLAVFEFGKECLFDTGLHLQGDLCISSAFSQFFQPVAHNITPMTLCHIFA